MNDNDEFEISYSMVEWIKYQNMLIEYKRMLLKQIKGE